MKKMKRALAFGISLFVLVSCDREDVKMNKDLKSDVEMVKMGLDQINDNYLPKDGKVEKWSDRTHAIIQGDCTGFMAGGKLGSMIAPGWGTLIGGGIGAGLLSYAISQDYQVPVNQDNLKIYDLDLIDNSIYFSEDFENIGRIHNTYLSQALKGERSGSDFLFDERISESLIGYRNNIDKNVALGISNEIEKLEKQINSEGVENVSKLIIDNESILVKETVNQFNKVLSYSHDLQNNFKIIKDYKEFVDSNTLYTEQEKFDLNGYLVVAKYSSDFWFKVLDEKKY